MAIIPTRKVLVFMPSSREGFVRVVKAGRSLIGTHGEYETVVMDIDADGRPRRDEEIPQEQAEILARAYHEDDSSAYAVQGLKRFQRNPPIDLPARALVAST